LIGDFSVKIQDQILAHGELLSAKLLVFLLNRKGIPAKLADTRELMTLILEMHNL
jgi:aspartokinase